MKTNIFFIACALASFMMTSCGEGGGDGPQVTGLTITPASLDDGSLVEGDEVTFTVTPIPEGASLEGLYWISEDETVATVEGDGLTAKATCVGDGRTNINVYNFYVHGSVPIIVGRNITYTVPGTYVGTADFSGSFSGADLEPVTLEITANPDGTTGSFVFSCDLGGIQAESDFFWIADDFVVTATDNMNITPDIEKPNCWNFSLQDYTNAYWGGANLASFTGRLEKDIINFTVNLHGAGYAIVETIEFTGIKPYD